MTKSIYPFQSIKDNVPERTKVHLEDPLVYTKIGQAFSYLCQDNSNYTDTPITFVCIGTDRSTGDSLGPLIGSQLAERKKFTPDTCCYNVLGTLDQPVHATNLHDTIDTIHREYTDSIVVAIDASLGKLDSVGCIYLGTGAIQPGAGVNKILPEIGDMHITGVVNVGGFMEYFVLQNTRLNMVMRMANTISNGLLLGYRLIKNASATHSHF